MKPKVADLAPCPFCGIVPKAEWNQSVELPHLIVRHNIPTDCALEMSVIIFAKDKNAAIEKWNRRAGNDLRLRPGLH